MNDLIPRALLTVLLLLALVAGGAEAQDGGDAIRRQAIEAAAEYEAAIQVLQGELRKAEARADLYERKYDEALRERDAAKRRARLGGLAAILCLGFQAGESIGQ